MGTGGVGGVGGNMQRVKREPSRLGVVDFADQVGLEFNLPLDRLSEKFSFDEAAKKAMEDSRLMYGRRAERMFEYVVASLGNADLVTAEDATALLYSGAEVQAPDYFVSLKSGEKYFVEVKNARPKTIHTPVTFSRSYLTRLKHYSNRKGHPLLIAVYWDNLNTWTINKVEDFETKNGTINLRFVDALQRSIAGTFGDRMIAAVPPLICRIHADPKRPSSIQEDKQASFTISALSFYTEHQEILNEREKQIAFYLMFHSSWKDDIPTAKMNGDRVEYVEVIAEQTGDRDPAQEFESLGTLAGMISSYYKWLTTADDEIVRLTPQLGPGELAPGLDGTYHGEFLRLWQFEIRPNYDSLIKQ